MFPKRCIANKPCAASHVFRYEALNRVIYNVVWVDIERERKSWQDPWECFAEDLDKGLKILHSLYEVTNKLGV